MSELWTGSPNLLHTTLLYYNQHKGSSILSSLALLAVLEVNGDEGHVWNYTVLKTKLLNVKRHQMPLCSGCRVLYL